MQSYQTQEQENLAQNAWLPKVEDGRMRGYYNDLKGGGGQKEEKWKLTEWWNFTQCGSLITFGFHVG